MATDVLMPQMGESILEGTVIKWLKKPGDKVARDEPLFEISTDKVDAEIPAPAAGVLREIKVAEGQTVPIQTVVALIDADGVTTAADAPSSPASAESTSSTQAVAPATNSSPALAATREGARSSPLVRRLAEEHQIDLATVHGTGAGGRVSKEDVLAAMAARQQAGAEAREARSTRPTPEVQMTPAAAANSIGPERVYFGRHEVQPMSAMRQRIAEHMVLSKRIAPHVYSLDESDMSRIVHLRGLAAVDFDRHHGLKLTFLPFFIRACVEALRAFPTVNASVDGANLVLHEEINIGVAVALEGGLIVPVLEHTDEKSFLGIQRAVNDLAERARSKQLKPEEVQRSTFSIINVGGFGGLLSLPIINQPNVAILGIGGIQKRPVVVGDAIAIRSMVYLTLSYDHRALDGAIGHQFLLRVKRHLETWEEPLL